MLTSTKRVAERPDVGCSTFDDVLTHYQTDIYRFAVHLTRDRAEANDLYRETLLKACHVFDERDRPGNCKLWLFTIATDAFLNHRRPRGPRGAPGEEQAAELRGASAVRADPLDAHALRREVEAFVATLPRQQWVALVQRRYLNRGYAEIAETLCCSEAKARASVYEALRAMRVHIGDRL